MQLLRYICTNQFRRKREIFLVQEMAWKLNEANAQLFLCLLKHHHTLICKGKGRHLFIHSDSRFCMAISSSKYRPAFSLGKSPGYCWAEGGVGPKVRLVNMGKRTLSLARNGGPVCVVSILDTIPTELLLRDLFMKYFPRLTVRF